MLRLNMWRAHNVGTAGIDNDQLCTGASILPAQAAFHPAGKNGVTIGGVCTNNQDDIAVLNTVKILRAGAGTKSGFEAISGRRMAYARASIDVIVTKTGTYKLLHEEGFFIGATAGRDAAKGVAAIFFANPLQFGRGISKGLIPFDFAPRVADRFADHGLQDAFLMLGIAPSKAALDAAMTAIGFAVFIRNHTDQLFAAHFRAEGAANTAIGASRYDAAFRCADFDNFFLDQSCGRAGLHTGTARNAFRTQKIIAGKAGGYFRIPSSAFHRERKRALHFVTGADATRASDALARIEIKIGVGVIFFLPQMCRLNIITHIAQAYGAGLILQFAVPIGGAC